MPTPDQPAPKENGGAACWVRVIAPGIDVAVKMDDADAKAIIAKALEIAERRTKQNEATTPPQQDGQKAD